MDFAAEQKLCQLAHEVWLRAAAEPVRSPTDFADGGIPADVGVIVRDALHLRDVFPLEGSNAIAP